MAKSFLKILYTEKFFILALSITLLVAGCARMHVFEREKVLMPPSVPAKFLLSFNDAERAFNEGMLGDAAKLYKNILKKNPPEDLAAWSYLRIGEVYSKKGEIKEATRYFHAIVKNFPKNPLHSEARYQLALCYSRLGRYDISQAIAEELQRETLPSARVSLIQALIGDNFMGQEKPFEAVTTYLKAIKGRPDAVPVDDIKKKIEYIIHERLSFDQLEKMRQSYWYGYPSGHILYSLAQTCYQKKDFKKARSYISSFIFFNKRHPYLEKAISLRERLKELEFVDQYAIGCILPLTGKDASFGNRALEAIILAAGILDPDNKSPFKLFIEDSKSDPATARNAVVKLAEQAKVIGIIGTLRNDVAIEASAEAQKLNIPILTLSPNEEVTGTGNYVFRNSMTDIMQIRTLVKYSVHNLGMNRFAILYPKDDYGNKMMNLFRDELLHHGGEITAIGSYDIKQTDFGKEIKSLAGLSFMEKDDDSEEEPTPVIDFDALFIPDSYSRVIMIAPQLAFYDVTGIQLLGTNRWNSPDLFNEEGKYLEGAIFVDGFFKDSSSPVVRDFIDNFYVVYGREPDYLEAIAYDAASIMVSALCKNGAEIRDDLKDGLLKLHDYPGITGETSFSETGEAKKPLVVLMVQNGGIVQIH